MPNSAALPQSGDDEQRDNPQRGDEQRGDPNRGRTRGSDSGLHPHSQAAPAGMRAAGGPEQRITSAAAADGWSPEQVAQCRRLLSEPVCQRLGIYSLPASFVLTVIVPVYNEAQTIDEVIDRLRATGIAMQIILVDDGSGDGTSERMAAFSGQSDITVISHGKNRGKGAAIRTALAQAMGDIIVIQDADREYDPQDFRYLMQPILEGRADVVYGTRYGHVDRQVSPLWHELVNAWLTKLANWSLGIRLSDVETCYKMAPRAIWMLIQNELREDRFGIEIELTARWARRKLRFFERPIRYQHRWYSEGKKIGWKDGVAALVCIVRYGWLRR